MKSASRSAIPRAAFVIICIAYMVFGASGLARRPEINAYDAPDYLEFADFVPPLYPTFLWAYRQVFAKLDYLPQVQFLAVHAAILLLALSVGRMARSLPASIVVFAASVVLMPYMDFDGVMSDALYTALLITGVAGLLWALATDSPVLLPGAVGLVALAAITRTVGCAPLLACALVLALVSVGRRRWRGWWLTSLLVAALVFAAGAAVTQVKTGSFRIGSSAGVSLLGKGVMVSRPQKPQPNQADLNIIPKAAAPAQQAFSRPMSPPLKMLVLRQYYEYLRWHFALDAFENHWPEWRQEASGFERSRLALQLSYSYIRKNPGDYVRLALLDYGALWIAPRFLTSREARRLNEELASLGELPYLTAHSRTEEGQLDYFRIVPAAQPPLAVWCVRVFSGAALLTTLLAAVIIVRSLRQKLAAPASLFGLALLLLIVHSTYLSTALIEAGLDRYIQPTWPLLVAAVALTPIVLADAWARAGGRKGMRTQAAAGYAAG